MARLSLHHAYGPAQEYPCSPHNRPGSGDIEWPITVRMYCKFNSARGNPRASGLKNNFLKRGVKRGLQKFCAAWGPHTRHRSRPELLILMYHRILPRDDQRTRIEEPGMIVTPETFSMHLDLINQYFEPVHLDDWSERCKNNDSLPNRACAITLDDGWVDNYEFAYPLLQEKNIPATIYLVTKLIGTSRVFWPEKLAHLLIALSQINGEPTDHPAAAWLKNILPENYRDWQHSPAPENITLTIKNAKIFSDSEIFNELEKIELALDIPTSNAEPSLLNWDQIAEMTATGLVNVASHTRNHIRLGASTPYDLLESEIVGSKTDIEEKTGRTTTTFCYPNGDLSPQALELVRQHYRCAVTTESGWNSCGNDSHLLQRIAIHEDISNTETAFLAKISGWM